MIEKLVSCGKEWRKYAMAEISEDLKEEYSELNVCANCGRKYSEHGPGTSCPDKYTNYSDSKWFPKQLADAITKAEKKGE